MRNLNKVLLVLAGVIVVNSAFAATSAANVTVNATVAAFCAFATTTGTISLGGPDANNQFSSANAVLTVRCTPGGSTTPSIAVKSQTNGGLKMVGGTYAIPYGIGSATAAGGGATTSWATATTAITAITTTNQTLVTASNNAIGSGIAQLATFTLPVANGVYATQDGTLTGVLANAGNYTDTLVFTLTY